MARLALFGPYSWVRIPPGDYFRPGKQHYWTYGPAHASVMSVTAHARSRTFPNETVAIDGLSVTRPQSGDPWLNLLVINAGSSSVNHYSFYVSEVDF